MRHKENLIQIGLAVLATLFAGSVAMGVGPKGDEENPVSPARKIERDQNDRRPERRGTGADRAEKYRSIDGSGNNQSREEMGATGTPLLRMAEADYADGSETLSGEERPSARAISNIVNDQEEAVPNLAQASDYLWQWGQFVDHDIDLTDGVDPPEPADISVPAGDAWFDPEGSGTAVIALNRSIYEAESDPRQQLNEITAWIDASNVYGSDEARALALRVMDGSGRLKTSEGDLLPFNTEGLANAGGSNDTLFLAGDVRANEQAGLTAMHTLFVREHNRLADKFAAKHPDWSGDRIYEKARRRVGAQMQVITYREFLPALLGSDALRPYRGYDPDVDASIRNEFSSAAYRFGHSALSEQILRLDALGNEVGEGHLSLRDAFFNPSRITDEGGIEPLLRGLAAQSCQRVDVFVIDDVRNFLFGEPGSGGFDLASLNIQRGRDHGLPSYNDMREELGQGRASDFGEISSDPEVVARLEETYDGVDDVDLWVGGLAEDAERGSHLGPLFHRIVKRQFEALRDGDRFWYQHALKPGELKRVKKTRLSDVIRRNTDIGDEIPNRVFRAS